jgi:peptidoglycan/xylan/chitin deacetylase (PgdA/CDA1 family)
MIAIETSIPIVSFTFDDAPRTAFTTGGDILASYGTRATFFVSLGLLGSQTEVGTIGSPDDLLRAVEEGNELGCHTFDHLDAWHTPSEKFLQSVLRNAQALDSILPGRVFRAFAYPKSGPMASIKSRLEKYFICCRGGGQTFNANRADLNLVKACFLDRRTNIDVDFVRKLIDQNASSKGWLVFATHDVTDNPSPYGCTPEFLKGVVEYAARSGASLLPVAEACEKLLAYSPALTDSK